jgi:hypothetical protein
MPSSFMNRWSITDPLVFFGAAGIVVIYIIYMMIRRRKGERSGFQDQEADL